MSPDLVIWISVTLFMIHEFEEIICIRPWLDRHRNDPRAPKQVFWRFRDTSTATIAALIFEEYLLFSAVALAATLANGGELFFAGLLVPYAFHLIGHICEAVRLRMRTPSLVSSAITLPWYIYAVVELTPQSPSGIFAVAAWSLLFTAVIVANFALLYRLEPRVDRCLRGDSPLGQDRSG
ncbi:MAG: HXXEE domain-containing protein [Leucobacter sp.]